MKSYIGFILLLTAAIVGYSQNIPQKPIPGEPGINLINHTQKNQTLTLTDNNAGNNPAIFIDSIEVKASNSYLFFNMVDTKSIKSVTINKQDPQYPNGKIYVALYDHQLVAEMFKNQHTLGDIVSKHIRGVYPQSAHLFFMIDGQLLTDTLDVRIPELLLKKITILKDNDLPYFKTILPGSLLIKISTKDDNENIKGVDLNRQQF
jgi:hypothetical protein